MQRNFAPLHCDGRHKHASLLGGRDDITGAYPSRATATYTSDTCARLADAFVRSSPELAAKISDEAIPLPTRDVPNLPAAAHLANTIGTPDANDPLA